MTVRDRSVCTMLAPSCGAKSYRRSIHQSVSLRDSQGVFRPDSIAGGMLVPVCGMHSSSGAVPRCTFSQADVEFIGDAFSLGCTVAANHQ